MTINNNAGEATFPTSTELAMDRTLLAHDRTLMAWGRTATSLISFGRQLQVLSVPACETGDRRIYLYQQSAPSQILLKRLCGPVTGLNRRGARQALWRARTT
jgi:uncharacterized membrane protein YidH (DUF202 family)